MVRAGAPLWILTSSMGLRPGGLAVHLMIETTVLNDLIQGYLAHKKTPTPLGPP